MVPTEEACGRHPETLAVPFGVELSQMAIGHYVSRALCLTAKLGLADLLKDGPRDGRDLAAATQTHAPSLGRVLRMLASVGVFEERSDGGTHFEFRIAKPKPKDLPFYEQVRPAVQEIYTIGLEVLVQCWRND